ncbi:MAG TPA: tetratricopeptide repeat protein [Pseudolabrys sp.]|nr:tetratricopeptide repeat protein [Pseudolabrys sp.]
MTASPLSPAHIRARANARRPRHGWRALAMALMLLAPVLGGRAQADVPIKGDIKVIAEGGFVRLAFRFEKEVPASIELNYPIIVVTFKKPVAITVDRLNTSAPDIISAARLDPDGSSIRIALKQQVKLNSIPVAERLYVDLLPANWIGVMPGLPQDVVAELAHRALEAERQLRQQRFVAKTKKPEAIRVKVAVQPTFTRYVFTMPEMANVVPERDDGKLTLDFDQAIKWDLADAKAALPPTLQAIDTDVEDDSASVTFAFNGTPQVRTFREDRSIVVDVEHDGAKPKREPKQAAGEGGAPKQAVAAATAIPAISPPETVPAKDAAAEPPSKDDAAPVATAPKATEVPEPVPSAPAKPASKVAEPAAPKEDTKPAMADVKQPAPNPDAAVVTALRRSGDLLRAEFPFAVPTPSAVFSRADMLWLVFDSAAKIDVSALDNDPSHAIQSAVLTHGADGEVIVRIKLERPRLVSLEADGPGWVVTIADTVTVPNKPLAIARNIVGKNRASIAIPFDKPGKLHMFTDRGGEQLMVITALGPPRGFLKGQNFVELRALPSIHGVVLQPLADDLTTELSVDKILIGRPGGLALSTTATRQQEQLASNFGALSFDTQLWSNDREANFGARQAELIRLAALVPASKRKQARFNLARFYLAREMSSEAKAVLDVALSDKNAKEDVTGNVLKAVSLIMLDRPDDALKELSNPRVGNQLDAPIWRAIAYAGQSKWPQAHTAFKDVDKAVSALPIELQRMALSKALRTAIEVRDFGGADRIVNEFESIGVPPEMEPAMAVLSGRLNEALGHKQDALANYRTAADSRDRRAAAVGRLREIALRVANDEMTRKDAINALELLTTVWRGDETEAEGLALLAHLYTLDNRYRDALHTMRVALTVHANSDYTRKIQDEAAVTFDNLFLGGKADALPPVEALGMFYDFRDLTPIGRRGDEMIRRLTDRLVSVDLLDQAAELLQHQVDHRLQGAARAQVASRLAVIYLMNRKPDRALSTLQTTRTADLSNELRDERLLLEARALSDIGRYDVALELIANISSHEAIRLRSDILWAARHWRAAAEQIEILYGDRWREFTPLSETERFDILRAAIGYSLGDEPIGLARLRERYAAKMADTPDRGAFDVVSAPIGTASADFQEIARKIAGVDSLDTFLRDMRTRYPDSAAISPGVANKTAPPAAPAKTKEPAAQAATPEKAAVNTPAKPGAAAPPKTPTAAPVKPDQSPTGSISPTPRAR